MFALKHNDAFAVLDAGGNARQKAEKADGIADGLFRRDTRIVSRSVLKVNGEEPAPVKAWIEENNAVFHAELSAKGDIGIRRTIYLWDGALYEKAEFSNTGKTAQDVDVHFDLGADFADIFETRGWERKTPGNAPQSQARPDGLQFSHDGLDGVTRKSSVIFSEKPQKLPSGFSFSLAPGATHTLYARLGHSDGAEKVSAALFDAHRGDAEGFVTAQMARRPVITSSSPGFDRWLRQNAADIALLTTEFDTGPFPCAGIPWYATPFGRDGIITAFELLWQDPELAKGVLGYLAKHQAGETSAFRDSAPGKIMHEIRLGEMAGAQEVPHTPYYGTVDATPLFISLAGAYYERTGDAAYLRQLWPHVERALGWIDRHGDLDGDGFVEYLRGTEAGLSNQGWKDSLDSVSHRDGALATGAIALCEVQGYVYDAKLSAARIARALGLPDRAQELENEAQALKEKFNRDFWSEELGTYAIALDGDKKPCLTSTSNPGHLLFSGIVPPERAVKVAERLMADDMFSGWGIRTLSSGEKRFEPSKHPEGYHNGTVWTHDTALCAAGFARYGMEDKAASLMTALFEAAAHFPLMRLPELFGGLAREDGKPPAPYPVACNPQAWASASESLLLQAMLGIRIDGPAATVTIENPQLPDWLDALSISDLKVGTGSISLEFRRVAGRTQVEQIAKSPQVTLKISKNGAPRP